MTIYVSNEVSQLAFERLSVSMAYFEVIVKRKSQFMPLSVRSDDPKAVTAIQSAYSILTGLENMEREFPTDLEADVD